MSQAIPLTAIPLNETLLSREGEALGLPTLLPSFSRDPEKFARGPIDHANERTGELRRRAFWRVRFAAVIGWTAACQNSNWDGDVTRPPRSPPEIAATR